MSMLDQPIPPRPAEFSPFGAPPGVVCDFEAFRAFNHLGETIPDPWWPTRSQIKPRLLLVHTNGARGEGKLPSQSNWANAGPNNTHPHYAINAPTPTKFVPSTRKGIGNYKVADWSIVVETADAGWPVPGDEGGFLYDHAEIVARVIAYESIVADVLGSSMPIAYPDRWDGAGVGCHTEPFGYPYWTNVAGKPCPGRTKKRQVRDEVMPRARQIRAAWLGTPEPDPLPPEDDDMARLTLARVRGHADAYVLLPATQDLLRRLDVLGQPAIEIDCDTAELERQQGYRLTPLKGS